MASYLRTCHNVWFLRGLPLAEFQRRMCFLHLQSWEPIIKCSAYEAGIYFKFLCQYFCLKAGLVPRVDFVEASYHCFLFEFDLASFLPDVVFCRMACMKAFWLSSEDKVSVWISKPRKCAKEQTLAEGIREVTAIKQCWFCDLEASQNRCHICNNGSSGFKCLRMTSSPAVPFIFLSRLQVLRQ